MKEIDWLTATQWPSQQCEDLGYLLASSHSKGHIPTLRLLGEPVLWVPFLLMPKV